MKKIKVLCFGDSNTWGYIPGSGRRYGQTQRWCGVLRQKLGKDCQVFEDGVPGRRVAGGVLPRWNGSKSFCKAYDKSKADVVVIMLGTNDLHKNFCNSPQNSCQALQKYYIDFLKEKKVPLSHIILVAPSIITDGQRFLKNKDAALLSKDFEKEYKKLAKKNGCSFVSNAGVQVGEDGLHLTEESHALLAEKVYNCIKNLP